MIPIDTPKGTFQVWTKRVGNNPTIKVLLLHGGPGATHEAFVAQANFDTARLLAPFQPGLKFCDLLLLQLNDTRQDRDDVYGAKPGAIRTGD